MTDPRSATPPVCLKCPGHKNGGAEKTLIAFFVYALRLDACLFAYKYMHAVYEYSMDRELHLRSKQPDVMQTICGSQAVRACSEKESHKREQANDLFVNVVPYG